MKKIFILLSILVISCSSETIDIEPLTVKEKIISISSVWKMVETTPHSDVYLSFEDVDSDFILLINNLNLGCYFEIVYSAANDNANVLEDTDNVLKIEIDNGDIWAFTVVNDIVTFNVMVLSTGIAQELVFNPSTFNKTNEVNCTL